VLFQFDPRVATGDTFFVTACDRDMAINLVEDLIELAEVIRASLQGGPTAGPIAGDTCERLSEAIGSLVTLIDP
jgi:hypothetical protein